MPATIKINELHRQRAEVSVNGGRGGRTERGFQTAWRVFKSDNGRPLAFTATEALDAVAAQHPFNETFAGLPGVRLLKLAPQEEAPNIFVVTGDYGVPDEPDQPDDFDQFLAQSQSQRSSQNPNGAELSASVYVIEEYDYQDLKGNWFTNSAGDPLQTLIPIPVNIKVRRVTLNMRRLPDDDQVGMADGRNLFFNVESQSQLHVDRENAIYTPYWRVTYEMWIHTRRDWVPTIVWDAGYNQVLPDENGDPQLKPIVDPKTKQPYNTIRFLNGAGQAIPPPQPPNKIQPHPLKFYVRREGKFTIPFLT